MPKNYNLYLKGGVGGWNFNADMVNWVLDKHKDSEVHVLIDSLGGNVDTALSISSLFKIHGNVHVHYVGMNASAATIAAMGAKRITIDESALFLVHKCMYLVLEWDFMNADELAAHIDELKKAKKDNETIDGCIAGMYAKRCKKTKDELLALMKEGAWLTAQQALEWGFVDEITHDSEDLKPEITAEVINSLSDAGIPFPPIQGKKKNSIMAKFMAFLHSPFSNNDSEDAPAESQNHSNPMAKILTALGALLGVSVAVSDDKVSLTADQAVKINDTLDANLKEIDSLKASVADKDKELAKLKADIADKVKTIADLRKEPADSTGDVVDKKKDADPYAPVSEAEALEVSKAFMDSNF